MTDDHQIRCPECNNPMLPDFDILDDPDGECADYFCRHCCESYDFDLIAGKPVKTTSPTLKIVTYRNGETTEDDAPAPADETEWDGISKPSTTFYRRNTGALTAIVAKHDGRHWGYSLWLREKAGSRLIEGFASPDLDCEDAIAMADALVAQYHAEHPSPAGAPSGSAAYDGRDVLAN